MIDLSGHRRPFYYSSLYRLKASPPAAARDAFYPILFFQMVILLFMGTGSVAGGISRESADGMIDYQRLTPMTPLAKIVGYLFGLPVREYVLFAVTLPFTIFCIRWNIYSMTYANAIMMEF